MTTNEFGALRACTSRRGGLWKRYKEAQQAQHITRSSTTMTSSSAERDRLAQKQGIPPSWTEPASRAAELSLRFEQTEEFSQLVNKISRDLASPRPFDSAPETPKTFIHVSSDSLVDRTPRRASFATPLSAISIPVTPSPSGFQPSPTSGSIARSHKHAALKETDHIPRPENAWMIFRREFNERVRTHVASRPGPAVTIHMVDISKVAAAVWNKLSKDEKRPYHARAEEERKRHAQMYPNYRYRPTPARDVKRRRKRDTPPLAIALDQSAIQGFPQAHGLGSAGANNEDPDEELGELQYPDDLPESPLYNSALPESPTSHETPVYALPAFLHPSSAVRHHTLNMPLSGLRSTISTEGHEGDEMYDTRRTENPPSNLEPQWPWTNLAYLEEDMREANNLPTKSYFDVVLAAKGKSRFPPGANGC